MLTYSCISVEQKLSLLKMWSEYVVLKEAKNSPSLIFLIPNLTTSCIRQLFGMRSSTSRCYFFIFHFFLKTLLLIVFLFLQFEIKAFKLFDAIVFDFSLIMKEVLNMISPSPHIYNSGGWRCGKVVCFGSSSLKMGLTEANLRGSGPRAKRLSSRCCISIITCMFSHSIKIFHSILNLWKIVF